MNVLRVHAYRFSGQLLAVSLFAGLAFAPWAFGTTQPWSIATLNVLGTLAGAATLLRYGLQPRLSGGRPDRVARILAGLNLALLLYEIVAAINAQSRYDHWTQAFVPRAHWSGLPASLDPATGWFWLWRDLALSGFFWATRSWLLTAEMGRGWSKRSLRPRPVNRSRLRKLIWFGVLNGSALALVGLIQRYTADGALLWLVKPAINQAPTAQFGPYAYRSNAMQYLSMLWPLGLGLWGTQSTSSRVPRKKATSWLLPGLSLFLITCLFLSHSRMAALVGLAGWLAAGALIAPLAFRRQIPGAKLMLGALLAALVAGLWAGHDWMTLRLAGEGLADHERLLLREAGWRMVREYPVYGTGPGTFAIVHQFYLAGQTWYAQMHCDYLEILATFGWIGTLPLLGGLLFLLIGLLMVKSRDRLLAGFILIALLGCLAHASMDFPFQIYSTTHLFVIISALASTLAWTGRRFGLPFTSKAPRERPGPGQETNHLSTASAIKNSSPPADHPAP
ncbi:MAG: O-antigen ligase family protein [Verrucomicrobia bacterium]|jgi:O-antigen ligase|nr:O-antigen ligase family protein [Verrucomicrobiota bacterium]